MPPRLTELYHPGDRVELLFADEEGEEWRAGEVLRLDHPGLWVQTAGDRQIWYVTNARHIRPRGGRAG